MVVNSPYLLVVCLLEGRNFPLNKPTEEILIEAKFGNETLSTDTTAARDHPSFNCELAFELDRKALHLHRLQRTPVKLQVFCQCSRDILLCPLGQIVLDLRQAKEITSPAVWFPVLHCKHRGNRPEILICFYLETVKNLSKLIPKKAEQINTPGAHQKPDLISRTSSLELKMPSKSEQLSPQQPTVEKPEISTKVSDRKSTETSKSKFVEKKTVSKGSKPETKVSQAQAQDYSDSFVLPIKLNSEEKYYVLGENGETGHIYRLCVTIVFAERLELLKSSLPGPFCFTYTLFGNEIRTEEFPNLEKVDIPAERATIRIRGHFPTISYYFSQNQNLDVSLISLNSKPGKVIGSFTISLGMLVANEIVEGIYHIGEYITAKSLEEVACLGASVTLTIEAQANSNSSDSTESCTSPKAVDAAATSTIILDNDTSETKKKTSTDSKKERVVSSSASGIESRENGLKSYKSVSFPDSNESKTLSSIDTSKKDLGKNSSENNISRRSSDTELVHFCLNIDIKSVRLLFHDKQGVFHLQYSYPYVGANTPIQTSPMNLDDDERLVSNGQRSFCFVTTFQKLREAFNRLPLSIELIRNDKLAGSTRFLLEPLLNNTTKAFTRSPNVRGYRSTYDLLASVMDNHSSAKAEILLGFSLDRLEGPADAHCVTDLLHPTGPTPLPQSSLHAFDHAAKNMRQPTEAELRATVELELWREHQEEMFRVLLKKKEEVHLSVLAQEWRERDMEREQLLQTRLNECSRLENKLRQALLDIDSREVKVRRLEESVLRKEKDTQKRTEDLELKAKLQNNQQRPTADRNQKSAEHNFRCKILSLEKELEEKKEQLSKALDSKNRYKRNWASALHNLISLQNLINSPDTQVPAASLLDQRTTTVPKQRMAEERRLLENEKSQLREIQKSVERLKLVSREVMNDTASTSNNNSFNVSPEYLRRLQEERELLLGTGSYTAGDRVIQELDRQIKKIRDSL